MLGLPQGASLHTVRHSHASLLLEKGVDIATVSERVGHSSVATTAAIYSHALRGKFWHPVISMLLDSNNTNKRLLKPTAGNALQPTMARFVVKTFGQLQPLFLHLGSGKAAKCESSVNGSRRRI